MMNKSHDSGEIMAMRAELGRLKQKDDRELGRRLECLERMEPRLDAVERDITAIKVTIGLAERAPSTDRLEAIKPRWTKETKYTAAFAGTGGTFVVLMKGLDALFKWLGWG